LNECKIASPEIIELPKPKSDGHLMAARLLGSRL
jgi:hypothetical protein